MRRAEVSLLGISYCFRNNIHILLVAYKGKIVSTPYLFVWFDSLRPINTLSVMYGRVFLGWTSTQLGIMCLAQGHNAETPVRLEPVPLRSRVKHSATKPLPSLFSTPYTRPYMTRPIQVSYEKLVKKLTTNPLYSNGFPTHIDTVVMGLPNVHFKGAQVEFFKLQ